MHFKLKKEKRKKLEDLKLAESGRVVFTEGTLKELLEMIEDVLTPNGVIALLYIAGVNRGKRVVEYLKKEEVDF